MELPSIKLQIIVLYCLCILHTTNNISLKQIHMVFRHGERSPSLIYPTNSHPENQWPEGLGQLTKAGKLQMYNLGERLRKKYERFIPDYYFPEDIKVMSSYAERCQMSAQLFASNFLIPKKEQIWNEELLWQPIPINYESRNEDNIIAAKRNCTKYDNLYKNLFNTPKYKEIMEKNSEIFNYLTNHSGMEINTMRKVEELYNTLQIEEANNLSLPQWTRKVYPDPMLALASLTLASLTETEYMKRMKGGPFLNELVNDMEKSVNNEDIPKILIYSGHDVTLVNILRTLGEETMVKPNFAAYLIFELYSDAEIKIFYSDCGWCEESEFFVKNCGSPCYLNNFVRVLDPVLPKNWQKECEE